jgi:hypothetical protein
VRIDARGVHELRVIAVLLQQLDTHTRRAIRAFTKSALVTPWLSAIQQRASTVLEQRVIAATANVKTSDQNIRIESAAKGRRLSGGLNPKVHYPAIEFGGDRNSVTTYRRKGHTVSRRASRQLRPRNSRGYVFYPAAAEMIPRLASLWAQTVVRTIGDIFDGKEG